MAHNIGEMFYFGDKPWHELGVPLKRPADLQEALRYGGLDWEVETVPLVTREYPQSEVPTRVAVARKDRAPGTPGRVLGVVHPKFRPLQNREGAEIFDSLFGRGERVYHTGGYLRNGEVVWLLARLPEDIQVNGEDVLETYLLFANSHDGSIAIDIRLTTVRVVCNNTLTLALQSPLSRAFRRAHEAPYDRLKADARAFFDFSIKQSRQTQDILRTMQSRTCDQKAFATFLAKLLPEPRRPASAEANTAVDRAYETRRDKVFESRKQITAVHSDGIPARGISPADENWWGALNSVTAWVDHVQSVNGDRYAHLLLGPGDSLKKEAYELAFKNVTADEVRS